MSQGYSLITRQPEPDDKLGQILTISTEDGRISLQGILLRPMRIKNYIFSNTAFENMKFPETIELFNINQPEEGEPNQYRKLLGAGSVVLERASFGTEYVLKFNISLLDEDVIESIKVIIGQLGLTAYERFYPVMPVFEIHDKDMYCNICDEKLSDCKHEVGKDYFRTPCRAEVRKAEISSLVWSGLREFIG